jgi:hypothetical protein
VRSSGYLDSIISRQALRLRLRLRSDSPILVTTVVGLAIFLVAVLLSPETKGKVLIAGLTVA